MGSGLPGVSGGLVVRLVEKERSPEKDVVTHRHRKETGEIALVHQRVQAHAMIKSVHRVRFCDLLKKLLTFLINIRICHVTHFKEFLKYLSLR